MTDRSRETYCHSCGNALDAGAKFCGVCGQAVLAPPQSAQQIIPKSEAASEAPVRRGRGGRIALVSVAVLTLAIVILGAGALSILAFGDRLGLTGDDDPSDGQGEVATPAPESTTPEVVQERTVDIVTTPEDTTEAESPDSEDVESFLISYYSAASNEDWYFTYYSLSDTSRALFTLDEWTEAQNARIQQTGSTAPLEDAQVLDLTVVEVGSLADVELSYEDGTEETLTDVSIFFEGTDIKRNLNLEDIDYLEGLLEVDGEEITSGPECGIMGCPNSDGEYPDAPD